MEPVGEASVPAAPAAPAEAVANAAAQLLIALAFVVPKGTDLKAVIGPQLLAYRAALLSQQAEHASEQDFMECDACRAKPGSPLLCTGCLHNRTLIGRQAEHLETVRKENQQRRDAMDSMAEANKAIRANWHQAESTLRIEINHSHKLSTALEQAESTLRAMTEALRRYGQHETMCSTFRDGDQHSECMCGLDKALALSSGDTGQEPQG